MKKSAVIIAIALGFSFTSLNATNEITTSSNYETKVVAKKVVNPFCMAIVKGDFETVKKLIDLGQDINKKSNGLTPAMYAAKFNRVDILELLVDKGAKLELRSEKGMTASQYAKLSNAIDAIAYLEGLES